MGGAFERFSNHAKTKQTRCKKQVCAIRIFALALPFAFFYFHRRLPSKALSTIGFACWWRMMSLFDKPGLPLYPVAHQVILHTETSHGEVENVTAYVSQAKITAVGFVLSHTATPPDARRSQKAHVPIRENSAPAAAHRSHPARA